jgi:hypothetical protein
MIWNIKSEPTFLSLTSNPIAHGFLSALSHSTLCSEHVPTIETGMQTGAAAKLTPFTATWMCIRLAS